MIRLGRPSFADDLLLCQIAVPFRKSSTPGGFDSTPPTPLLLIITIVSNHVRLWLMAGTCAGYDDDAQISCELGEEGGQNVSLSMLLFSVNS